MLVPLAAALRASSAEPGDGGDIVAAAIIIHFPFSFCYHLACALWPDTHPVQGNALCKGDLVMIHCAGAYMALGTSGTDGTRGCGHGDGHTCGWAARHAERGPSQQCVPRTPPSRQRQLGGGSRRTAWLLILTAALAFGRQPSRAACPLT